MYVVNYVLKTNIILNIYKIECQRSFEQWAKARGRIAMGESIACWPHLCALKKYIIFPAC